MLFSLDIASILAKVNEIGVQSSAQNEPASVQNLLHWASILTVLCYVNLVDFVQLYLIYYRST